MERERKIKTIAVVALCLAIMGLGLGFAAFSSTLTISGTAGVNASSWEIKFQNLDEASLTGSASEVLAPTLGSDTSIGTFEIELKEPGDSVTYTFQVTNSGSFDAIITTFTMPIPTCEGTGENAETDATNVCNELVYSLKYSDESPVLVNDTLIVGQTKDLVLYLAFDPDLNMDPGNLPEADVTISDLGISIIYSQN